MLTKNMQYINNIQFQFKGIFRRFKDTLIYLGVFVLDIMSSLNNRYKQKPIINIMLTKEKIKF